MSSSYFALQIFLFGNEDTALAFNATFTLVLIAIRELEGRAFVVFEDEGPFLVCFFFNLGEGYTCKLTGALIL